MFKSSGYVVFSVIGKDSTERCLHFSMHNISWSREEASTCQHIINISWSYESSMSSCGYSEWSSREEASTYHGASATHVGISSSTSMLLVGFPYYNCMFVINVYLLLYYMTLVLSKNCTIEYLITSSLKYLVVVSTLISYHITTTKFSLDPLNVYF